MRRRLALWELGGFLFTAALGTVLHFTYGWSGGNLLAAAFSALEPERMPQRMFFSTVMVGNRA